MGLSGDDDALDPEEKEEEVNKEIKISTEQLKKEKRKVLSQILWILLLINFFACVIAFATVYQLYIPTLSGSLLFSISVLMGVLTIEGVILLFLGLVTKERNYADILMRSVDRRTLMMMSNESREREIEIFNQIVIFTKKLFLLLGIIFTISGLLYLFLPMFL